MVVTIKAFVSDVYILEMCDSSLSEEHLEVC